MLVWGSATERQTIGELPAFTCRTCKTHATHQIIHVYGWGHLWYLGAIGSKKFYSVCKTCQTTDEITAEAGEKFGKAKYPFNQQYGWALWVVLIIGLIISSMVASGNRQDRVASYLSAPKVGDLYVADVAQLMKTQDKFHYAVLKVKSLRPDGIEFDPSVYFYEYGIDAAKAKVKADHPGFFSDESVVLSKKALQDMREKDLITDIERRE